MNFFNVSALIYLSPKTISVFESNFLKLLQTGKEEHISRTTLASFRCVRVSVMCVSVIWVYNCTIVCTSMYVCVCILVCVLQLPPNSFYRSLLHGILAFSVTYI